MIEVGEKEYARQEGRLYSVRNKYERGMYGEVCVQLNYLDTGEDAGEEWERNLKISSSLIDLIECRDILEVEDILYDNEYKSEVFENYENQLCINNFEVTEILPIEKAINEKQIKIKKILTHEQYNDNCYKVEEN